MTRSRARAPRITGYVADPTSRKNVGTKPVGFGIWCPDVAQYDLVIIENWEIPYQTREHAEQVREFIDEVGHCPHEHGIVLVYPVYAGAVPKEAMEEETVDAR